LAICAAVAAFPEEEDVVVLTADNFDSFIKQSPLALVEFYAPWCGHCKQLAPHYAEAARMLQGEVPVAKVDCTTEKEVCADQQVRGFPTLKLFQNGKPIEYQGARTAEAIVSFIKKNTGPAALDVTQENLEMHTQLIVVLLFPIEYLKTKKESRIYANGFGGAKSADKDVPEGLRAKPKLTITRSQLAAVVPFVPVEELFEGLATGENGVRQVMSLLPCGNGWENKHPDYWRKTVKTVDGAQEQSISKITAKPQQPSASAHILQSESRQSARR
jgi:protein disulfide-isomerase-like protein